LLLRTTCKFSGWRDRCW